MTKVKERIYITKETLEAQHITARHWRHIERYIAVRSEVYGNVLDLACGVGYGSYLLSMNPDVEHVFGVDVDIKTIQFATKEYKNEKISFLHDIENINCNIDVLVSIETIEHIKNVNFLPQIARKFQIPKLIISFPHIKSTHFNPYHFHNFNTQQIKDLFPEWIMIEENNFHHDVTLLQFIADPKSWNVKLK